MSRLFYNLCLILGLALAWPLLLFYLYRRQGSLSGLGLRFLWSRHLPPAAADGEKILWLHGASMGEVQMLSPLVIACRKRCPAASLLITTMTISGLERAQQLYPEARVCLMPLDLSWLWRKFLRRYRPFLLLLAETELWPNLLAAAGSRRLPVVLVNARLSEKSFQRYRCWLRLAGFMFKVPSLILVQDENSGRRFQALGSDPARIVYTGSLKFDLPCVGKRLPNARVLPFKGSVVAGSLHPGEDEIIINAWFAACRQMSEASCPCLVLAPRHPHRFDEFAARLRGKHIDFQRFSRLKEAAGRQQSKRPEVLLLDTLGDLVDFYQEASLVILGGTLVSGIGGHNPLEAAMYAKAVLHGPHVESFRDGYLALDEDGGAVLVSNQEGLQEQLAIFLANPQKTLEVGRRAAAALEKRRGALSRTMAALAAWLPS